MQGFMYILECSDNSYYTGSTKDLETRLAQHQAGDGANHTKKRLPVKLVYYERYPRIDWAFEREKQVQGWSRKKKEALISGAHDQLPELAKAYRDIEALDQVSEALDQVSEALEDTDLKQQHLDFIKANPLSFNISPNGFSEEEVRFIEKYGNWMEALRTGALEPITEQQKEVVEELTSKLPWTQCTTEAAIWKKYLRRQLEEKDTGVLKAPPPTIKDDPFGSREDYKAMRKGQFKTITQQHRS